MPQKDQTSNTRKFFKISGIVLGCILGLTFIASVVFLSLIDPIAANYIKRQVYKNSDGQYKIEFEDFHLSIFNRSITFNDLHLIPDTALIQKSNNEEALIIAEIEMEKLTVKRINFVDAVFNNKVSIGSLSLYQPRFHILSKEADTEVNDEQKDQLDAFKDFYIFISEIEITEGEIKYSDSKQPNELQHHIPLLNLFVYDFSINHEGVNNRAFNADEVNIKVKDYEYNNQKDDINVNVSLFDFSSKTGELVVESMLVKSHPEYADHQNPDTAQTPIYDLEFPLIAVSGIQFDEIVDEKKLQFGNFLIKNPNISIEAQSDISLNNQNGNFIILKNLADKFHEIQVEKLEIQKGELEYIKSHNKQHEVAHHLEGLDFLVQSLHININSADNINFFEILNNINFTDAKLASDHYYYTNTLTPYTLSTSTFSWVPQNKLIEIDSLILKGDWDKNWQLQSINASKPVVFDINAPKIIISDIDIKNVLSTSKITVGEIILAEPHIKLLVEKNLRRTKSDLQSNEIIEDFTDYINQLSIEEINIQDASFTHFARERTKLVRKIHELAHASITFQDLEIDSLNVFNTAKKLPLQNIYLIAHSYKYWTPDNIHFLTLDKVNYSTNTQQLTAKAINIDYDTTIIASSSVQNRLRSLYDVDASSFIITGLELIEAINTGRLDVDEITLNHPDLKVLLNRNIAQGSKITNTNVLNDLFSFLNPITVSQLNLKGGTFEISEKRDEVIQTHLLEHASATVSRIRLNPNKVSDLKDELPFHNILLLARDYTYKSPDKIYNILLDSLQYSSNAQILTTNFIKVQSDKAENKQLKEESLDKANRNLFDISADKFQVTGLDLVHAYETGEYFMKELRIEEPRLLILQDKDVPVKKNFYEKMDKSKVMGQVAQIVETFFVENLNIINGTLTFTYVQDSLPAIPTIENISFSIENIRLASLETNDPLEMFEVDELRVKVRDFVYYFPDSLYVLKIGEVSSS